MALNVSSLRFDSGVKYVKLGMEGSPPTIRNLGNFTWMAWVKVNTTVDTTLARRLYVERQGTGTGIRFAATPSKDRLRFELCVTDGGNDTNYDFLYTWDENWHHIAFVGKVTGSTPTYEMYLDTVKVGEGRLVRSGGDTTVISDSAPRGGVCYLGCATFHKSGDPESFLEDRAWYGRFDEMIIYNTAKTQSDILSYVNLRNTLADVDPEMMYYYKFDENTGTSTTDFDNPANKGYTYKDGGLSTLLWNTDRPFIGHVTDGSTGPLDTTPPAQVTGLSHGTPTTDGNTLTWNATTDDINVQEYQVRVSTFSNFSVMTVHSVPAAHSVASTLNLTVTDLLPNQIYYWQVVALDARSNMSTASATLNFTTAAAGDVTAPDPPTAVTIGSVTYSSFQITITPDNTPEVPSGYKIDVAEDVNFNVYVSGWRNKDNGSLTTASVTGLDELSTYFVRVRQYDANGNESANRGPVSVVTSSRPDTVAPTAVDTLSATSVDGRRFTANWEEGQDNVGVTGYYLDVSTDENFGSYLTGYQNLNVGNVLSYLVQGLSENTTYYYRVRAYDAAGNSSDNDGASTLVTTRPLSLEDADETNITITLSDTAYVTSGAATTPSVPTDPWRLINTGTGAAATARAYFMFTVPTDVTTVTSAILYTYIADAGAGSGSFRVGTGSFDSTTLTWNNQVLPSNGPFSFTAGAVGTFQAIDITAYITGPGTYVVTLENINANNTIYWSSRYNDTTKTPFVELEYNLAPRTRVEQLTLDNISGVITNLITNPNFEANVTTGWTATNFTLSVDATGGVNGSRGLKGAATASAANPFIASNTIAVLNGDYVTVTFTARTDQPTAQYESNGVFSVGAGGTRADLITLSTVAQEFSFTYQATTGNGNFNWRLTQQTFASASNVWIDNISVTKTRGSVGYFDGSTAGAAWTSTANLSTSSMTIYQLRGISTYLGDSDDDNSVVASIRRQGESGWFMLPTSANDHNRTTNTVTTTVPTVLPRVNLIPNPSFEVNTSGYSISGSAVLTRDETYALYGTASLKVAITASTNAGIQTPTMLSVEAGNTVYARVDALAEVGIALELTITFLNSSNGVISETVSVVGTSQVSGLGLTEWFTLTELAVAPANTKKAYFRVRLVADAIATTFYVDGLMFGVGNYIPEYRDGTFDDAYFSGTSHSSPTHLKVIPNTVYQMQHVYTDPDGFLDGSGTTATVADEGTTATIPTIITIVDSLNLTPTSDTIYVSVPFQGDDNSSMTALVYYKRTDQTNYELAASYVDRNLREIIGTITDLTAGTSYDVRVEITDADGVYNATNGVVTGIATTLLDGVVASAPSLITYGGFVLNDETNRANRLMVTNHDAFGFPERRTSIEDIPRQDGGIETQTYWGTKTIRMEGIIEGADRGDLANALDSFKLAMQPRLQSLVINSLANTGRKYHATVNSLDLPETGGENFRHLPWSATFLCADPFAYALAPSVYGPISVTSLTDVLVTSAGGYDTFPSFTFTTTSTSRVYFDVINVTSGERITPERGILVDDILTIDCASASVIINGKEIGYSGIFPRLFAGTNTLNFKFSGGPLTVTIKWTDRWL